MATVYIIKAEEDVAFVESQILPVLPINGYSHWFSSNHLSDKYNEDGVALAMDQCQAIIIIVSNNIFKTPEFFIEVDIAQDRKCLNIVIEIERLADWKIYPARLELLPKIDFSFQEQTDAIEMLVSLLPSQTTSFKKIPDNGQIIEWSEDVFSQALARAARRHDHDRIKWLVILISNHVANLPFPYSAKHACNDMQILRQERAFESMRSYGNAIIECGTMKDKVRRLFAQALIETGHYDSALAVLHSILQDNDSSLDEIYEAKGLIGRTFKQQFLNAPDADGAEDCLRRAIDAYASVYIEDKSMFWHGINAASCLLRLDQQGWNRDLDKRAQQFAEQILEDLNQLSAKAPLDIWDCASKVEALVVLKRYNEAEKSLELYIHHPAMTAFEISSTYRQFNQLLQLAQIPEGVEILIRLRNTMERYRAGSVLKMKAPPSKPSDEIKGDESDSRAIIIRISNPSWHPEYLSQLDIRCRMGNIVTAWGSNKSISKLLNDPMVISIEDSRPSGFSECIRSIPFIKVREHYSSPGGSFQETGEHALIAIIDDSIDVLHKAFLDVNGNTRIVGIWDQTDSNGVAPSGFQYGTYYDKSIVESYIKTPGVLIPSNLGRNGAQHGTHVASIAAGRAVGSFAGGVAPDSKLLIVIANSQGPTGYSQSYIEALAFIDQFAEKLNLPVVVNVSQGMNAGAHDGKSSLEAAFDAFSSSGRKMGRVIVKSAGNERDRAGHAKITLLNGALEELRWTRLKGADPTEKIELWWSSANEIRFRLCEPLASSIKNPQTIQNWSAWVGTASPECSGVFPQGGSYNLVYTKRHVDNGDSLLVIELGRDIAAPAGLGEWLIEIEGIDIKENCEIHCWIERGFNGTPTSFQLPHVSEDITLSVPGTAESVITVGAIDACRPLRLGKFSSYGPTRDNKQKPLICAPGVNVIAADAGTVDNVVAMSGTSMAAPHVAGAISLLLSRSFKKGEMRSSNQIAAALRQKTQNYNGNWDRGQGYGVIDISALLAAFE